jgi:hypothetical protein
MLGSGTESRVYGLKVQTATPETHQNQSSDHLAIKVFRPPRKGWSPGYRNPEYHYATYQILHKLNQKQGNRLNLPPRINIVRGRKRPYLVKTQFPELKWETLTPKNAQEFKQSRKEQIRFLKKNGYFCLKSDTFYPLIDPQTKKCIAVINDFGTVIPQPDVSTFLRMYNFRPLRSLLQFGIKIKGKDKKK